ncbi:N-terminal domain of NEFA-interacting nuclear protein NIP30-domain-containing protein [Cunninghamella echinulata]|nr:N-terminal domain of NEFA-interacting nuclear protein NIP30-domain-containing protein [Cunninghamella echinulata]
MSFKNFVSHSIINNNEETEITPKEDIIANTSKTNKEEEYDPRTLYERLQEQKAKKEDEFREATRFSNLVKRVDPEEAEYYKSLSDTQKQLEEETKTKDLLALENYRRAVENVKNPVTAIKKSPNITTGIVHKANGPKTQNKPKKDPSNNLLIVKKKRETDHEEKNDQGNKKLKVDNTKAQSSKSTALNTLLATYNSDSDSDSD